MHCNFHTPQTYLMTLISSDESTRVCLQPIRGVDGSDYINASFIDVSICNLIISKSLCSILYLMDKE